MERQGQMGYTIEKRARKRQNICRRKPAAIFRNRDIS
jgi:hypothetical protein